MTHDTGVDVLLAPARPDQASAITIELLRDVLVIARGKYDMVIADTPPGFTAEVIATIDASSDLVMVGTLDSLSLKNTKLGLETLSLMDYDERRSVVLNRADTRVGISQHDVVAVLGREPDVCIPSDREIPRAVNEGVPITLSRPQSYAASSFHDLAALFTDDAPVGEPGSAEPTGRRRIAVPPQEEVAAWSSTSVSSQPSRPSRLHQGAVRRPQELDPHARDQRARPPADRAGHRPGRDARPRHRRHPAPPLGRDRDLEDDRERLTSEIADDILGYGPLERLLADDSITEIMVNGPSEIWIERQGRLYETTVRFNDDSHLRRIINRMVAQIGRRIDESSPMVDARLPDGVACQRDHRSALPLGSAAHDPQVLAQAPRPRRT